mmetsp:Transcript_5347/g.11737  ORF Transcript_5347/g.11737 Transcript_5347/m.11737 type:complete len:840 (+) Transcript_5347:52-2571(+)
MTTSAPAMPAIPAPDHDDDVGVDVASTGSADNYSSSDGDDGDDEFERASGGKQGLDQRSNRGTMDSATSSMLGGVGGGQGSWYFQPQYGTQLYGTQYTAMAGAVAGAPPPLPPHLAYWMQGDGTYANPSYGQAAMGQMGQMGQMANATVEGGYNNSNNSVPDLTHLLPPDESFQVYSSRWVMLAYMSALNLLSDWTCFSIAPIALLTKKAFGEIDPESLVTVFLGANAIASAMEPAILGRLGLRRTVLFGAMLLMVGSIVKSGGLRGIFMNTTMESPEEVLEEEEADETWRLYLGFFLVGLSQPLYQCTPALLSASWFPENERTMATGVALNSNQLGIGCAFVFGTMLVDTEEDIIPYFGLLSVIATITFVGTALQFDDAPPTPPSDTARVIKGDLVIKLPKHLQFIGRLGRSNKEDDIQGDADKTRKAATSPTPPDQSVEVTLAGINDVDTDVQVAVVSAPSPAPTDDPVDDNKQKASETFQQPPLPPVHAQANHPLHSPGAPPMPPYPNPYAMMPPPGFYPYPPMEAPPGIRSTTTAPSYDHGYDQQGHYHNALLDDYDDYAAFGTDEGAEPVMTQLDHQLDIDVRDDQLVQQFKACFRRPGFSHCIVGFTTAGIIVNTLSTFMDYLVTLNGAGREYVGIVGGTFQLLIMCASLVFGGWTDHSRKYYFVILAMLVSGAFALSACNVALDSDSGGDLRFLLLLVAVLAGPLQPLSTELGVEVVYPLSENTVLVIQQLFSNLLSAAFIPIFKALKDVGTSRDESETKSMFEVPQFTFSFYLLIIIHAFSTCYFATFNGSYLRYEAELDKKAKKEEEKERLLEDLHKQHAAGGYGSMEPN